MIMEKRTAQNLTFQTAMTVQPQDTNYLSTLFGGKLMQEMDACAGMTARRSLYDSVCEEAVTVHVDSLDFTIPGYIGDLVILTGEITSFGNTSIHIHVTAKREEIDTGDCATICEADFVFVSMKDGEKHPHGLVHPDDDASA